MNAPRCRQLRAKAMFISSQAAEALAEENDPVCWCNRTFHELGPDDAPVHPSVCVQGRACFEPQAGLPV